MLDALRVPAITRAERYYLFAATGDEVLDYREMLAHYPGAKTRVIEGSDHGISEFADYVDDVSPFATERRLKPAMCRSNFIIARRGARQSEREY